MKNGEIINGFNVSIEHTLKIFTFRVFKAVHLTEIPHSVATISRKVSKRRLVWFHGNAEIAREAAVFVSNLFSQWESRGWKKHRWLILIVEYPGFDGTDVFPQTSEREAMVNAWHHWLNIREDSDIPTYLFGRSIGTAIATD